MPVPLVDANLLVTVTAGPGIGPAGTAALTATTPSGSRGRLMVTTDALGLTPGGVAAVSFGRPLTDISLAYSLAAGGGAKVMVVGSFADHELRPIAIAVHPPPPLGLHFLARPQFSTPTADQPTPRMTGFQLIVSPALAPATTYVFAWVVL